MSSEAPSDAVRIRDLSKQYRLSTSAATTLAELLSSYARGHRPNHEKFWALQGIDLDIAPGEVLGIVGHNGAGKSTLLKILSRVTEPTTGEVRIRGKVGALLEVGTGFHPELTGRENVFLNGSILGMRRAEVFARFDAIVDFAGVGKFLDIPVKRYSSGMSVRLAFSIASSLSSDVLIVDEVLAVGDAEFQKRCLGRMAQVSGQGRTVLFVSHNLPAVQALCTRAVLLKSGRITHDGLPADIVHTYLSGLTASGIKQEPGFVDLSHSNDGAQRLHLRALRSYAGGRTEPTDNLVVGGQARFELEVDGLDEVALPHVGLSFWTESDALVATATTQMRPATGSPTSGRRRYTLTIERLPLLPGTYWIDVGVRAAGAPGYVDLAQRAMSIDAIAADVFGSGVLPAAGEGLVFVDHSWTVQ